MKIVLVSHQDNRDIRAFSGTSYFMSRAIKKHFEEVEEVFLPEPEELLALVHHNGIEQALKPIGINLSNYLKDNHVNADFIICQGGSSSIPYTDSKIPIVLWHDSTWHTFLHGYSTDASFNEFKTVSQNLYNWDRSVLERADLLVYSSNYIAEACVAHYKIGTGKLKIIPFGANIHEHPIASIVDEGLRKRKESKVINLTFLGIDWKRKGLESAFQLTKSLNKIGFKAMLNIIGCYPDDAAIADSEFTIIRGKLDKSKHADLALFESIMQETHFLLHPAISEPFGIAMCEANAYGVPILGSAVEGLKTIIVNDKNGYLIDRENFVKHGLKLITHIFSDFDKFYVPLFHGSLEEFNQRLNWTSSVLELKKVLKNIADNKVSG